MRSFIRVILLEDNVKFFATTSIKRIAALNFQPRHSLYEVKFIDVIKSTVRNLLRLETLSTSPQ